MSQADGMRENDRQNLITEGRQLYLASPALAPILERMQKLAYQELLGGFRDGVRDQGPAIAKLWVIDQIQREIRVKIEAFDTLTTMEQQKEKQ